jgi:hypothetical protein
LPFSQLDDVVFWIADATVSGLIRKINEPAVEGSFDLVLGACGIPARRLL